MDSNDLYSAINEYRESLWDEIGVSVATNLTMDIEEFVEFATEQLIEAEEIEDFSYIPYEGLGKRNKKIKIDGYFYSELDECLSLFIATPLEYRKDDVLTATEANRYFAMAIAFLDNAEYIKQNAEESSPGYGLAIDVLGRFKSVEKYKIYLLSDRIKSKNISFIEASEVRGKQVECNIWDITRLFELINSSRGREEIIINFEQLGIKGIPCMLASDTEDYRAYLCNMPGIVLANLYNKYGSRLLEGNVRSFLQVRGKVNKGIRSTILNEPEMFFAYNNGIAATAYDIKVADIDGSKYITEISSLQIVNGGQTTASLATALLKDKKDNAEENINRIFIPMKLSIVHPDNANKLIANIARYANSQNKVSDADLWSNHPYHIRLEEFSRRIIAPATNGKQFGTYWYYERANGQYNQETYKATPKEKKRFQEQHPKTQKITKTDLAKYMHIYAMRPDIASQGGQKAFVKFAEEIAKKWDKHSTDFNEEYYKKIVALAILFKESDKIVRRQYWYKSYKANIVAYTLSYIFFKVNESFPEKVVNYKNIWQKQMLPDAWIRQIEETSFEIYKYLTDENRGIENVTEWAKRELCWKNAKKLDIGLNQQFIDELLDAEEEIEAQESAKDAQKLADKLNSMVDVVNYGSEGWTKLLKWNEEHRVLAPSEIHLIELAKRLDGGVITSEYKCERIMKILTRAKEEGFPG